jgi:3-oxoacyl-(acyl-carrier-protein) synthase
MSDYVKFSLAATSLAFADAGITDVPTFTRTCSAVLGSTHGSANYSRDYYRQIVDDGMAAANPMLFAEGVPNAGAAHLSLMMSLNGACQTIIGSRVAGLDALRLASERIAQGRWDRAVVSAGEEFCQTVNDAYRHCGHGFPIGCGAVTLILESRASVEARGGRVRGRVVSAAGAAPGEGREVEAVARVICELGAPAAVLGSGNATRLDRVEAAAVRLAGERVGRELTMSTLEGAFAETFSVTPLLGVAAVLLGRGLPRAGSADAAAGVAVLGTNYTGTVCGVRLGLA